MFFLCPETEDISATEQPIGVKVCMMVELRLGWSFSSFGGDIFRDFQMWGQYRVLGGPFLASQTFD